MMTNEQFLEIAQDLEIYHGIFSKMWQIGKPIEDLEIKRAAIRFDKNGNFFSFCFNPDFYKTLDLYNIKFIVCHELLHVLLNHGIRSIGLDPTIANIAMDVVINESLVRNFGFDRSLIKDHEMYCWYDTVFKPEDNVFFDKSFEYYYDLLCDKSEKRENQNSRVNQTVDTHDGFGSEHQDQINQTIDGICDELSNEELNKLKTDIEKLLDVNDVQAYYAGKTAGGLKKMMDINKIPPKRKWETVIRKWALKHLKNSEKAYEQWARLNRRFATLNGDLMIPTEMEIDHVNDVKNRIKIIFFLDTSGSCTALADRFWKAAKTLPKDRFEMNLCCFDTEVYETTLESGELYGFGGTSFYILENYVQQYKIKNNNKYPDAVFVITDGMGDSINPEIANRWHWFLSHNYTQCIPNECNIYMLSDYE